MKDRIFDDVSLTNPNNRALVVPPEEGGSDDDGYFGSIGDATAKHVSDLAANRPADRQLWEGLISTRTGKIWRTQPSTSWHDTDPLALVGKDLEKHLQTFKKDHYEYDDKGESHLIRGLTDAELAPVREAMELEVERREASRDVYDRAELIPYDQMEKFPGMMKHIDVPTTPKDWLIFMGNSNDIFYDEFPEGHPDQRTLRICLMKLNRPWETITDDYAEWFCEWVEKTGAQPEVVFAMQWLVRRLSAGDADPVDLASAALKAIDDRWQKQYKEKGLKRFRKDPIWDLLKTNAKKWEGEAQRGATVYPAIRAFGRLLFEEYKDIMRGHHWSLYRSIRDSHAPKVFLKGVDINRASVTTLRKLLKLPARDPSKRATYTLAEEIWYQRPFQSLSQVRDKGLIDHRVFAEDKKSDELLIGLEQATEQGKTVESFGPLNEYRKKLIQTQRQEKNIDWSPIWTWYHLLKAELTTHIKEQEDERRREDERAGPGLPGDLREDGTAPIEEETRTGQ